MRTPNQWGGVIRNSLERHRGVMGRAATIGPSWIELNQRAVDRFTSRPLGPQPPPEGPFPGADHFLCFIGCVNSCLGLKIVPHSWCIHGCDSLCSWITFETSQRP